MSLGVMLFAALLAGVSAFAQTWDVDAPETPAGSKSTPPPAPTSIKPFTFLFYQVCESSRESVHYTGRYSFEIYSEYRAVGFDHSQTDSTVTIKLRSHNRGEQSAKLWFPRKPFTLFVILGRDTAAFAIDLSTGRCDYRKQSTLLRLEAIREIPRDVVTMQFMDQSRNTDRPRQFLDQIKKVFRSSVEPFVLSPGYYPCLPAFAVRKTGIGRRQALNATPLGYLAGIRVTDTTQLDAVSRWIWERQQEEFQRAKLLGVKGE